MLVFVQDEASVTVAVYVPVAANVTKAILGFWVDCEKLLGPDHEYESAPVPPEGLLIFS